MIKMLAWVAFGVGLHSAAPAVVSADGAKAQLESMLDGLRQKVGGAGSGSGPSPMGSRAPSASTDAEAMAQQRQQATQGVFQQLDALMAMAEQAQSDVQSAANRLAEPKVVTRYVYIDDQGARRQVTSLDEVPEIQRANAVPVSGEAAGVEDSSGPTQAEPRPPSKAPQTIYKYRGEQGRTLYTNVMEQVPQADREAAIVNLAEIPLNSAIGAQINRRMQRAHAKLTETPLCKQARAQASTGMVDRGGYLARGLDLWRAYTPVIVCGGLLLFLLLISPIMIQKVDGDAWRRVLMFAMPALLIAGGSAQMLMKGGQAASAFMSTADQCDPASFKSLLGKNSPLAERMAVLQALQQELGRADGR